MQEAYVNICDIPTHVITWGKWIEESLDGVKEIVVCITGNPGLPGFYTKFLSILYSRLDFNTPVWIIGHAGHDEPPSTSIRKVPPLTGNESRFNLEGQIKHKIEFIEKYIPQHVKIHLIGHSIGAWIILQMLKKSQIKERIQKCYMLFPTIERMEESPNGWLFTRLCLPFMPIIRFLLLILSKLPISVKFFLIYTYFWIFSIPNYFIGTTAKYLTLSIIERVVFLAKIEMSTVRELEVDAVKDNRHLLKFYYGYSDGWVPLKYYHEILEKIPDIDAELGSKNILHAFVLRSSEEMAVKVSDWIKDNSVEL